MQKKIQEKNFFYPGVAVMFIVATVTLGWIYLVNGTTIGTDIETVNFLGTGTTTLATTTIGTNFYIDETGAASTTGSLLIDTSTFYVDASNNAVSVGTTTYSGLFAIATSTATTSDILFNITTEGSLGAGIPYDNDGALLYGSDLFYVNTPSGAVSVGTSTAAGVFTVGTTTGTAMLYVTTEGNLVVSGSVTGNNISVASSSGWDIAEGIVTASSTDWNTTFNTINASSSAWDTSYTWLVASSTDWSAWTASSTDYVPWASASTSAWDIAYGWGDHASGGYIYPSGESWYLSDPYTLYSTSTVTHSGIGTTTPSAILNVYAATDTVAIIFEQDSTGDILDLRNATGTVLSIDNGGNLTVDTSTLYVDTANDAVVVGTTTAQGIFTVGSTSDAFFNVTTEGNVAVGTSTAAGVFTVGTTTGDAIFNINTAGGVVVGGGSTAISKILFGTVAIDPEPIATSSTSVASSTVSGLTTDMQCFVTPPDVLNDELVPKGATTTASDKLGVYLYNEDVSSDGADIDDGSLTWGYLCIK